MTVAKGRIVVKSEGCKGCGYCQVFCPKNCIEMGGQTNAKGYFYAVFQEPETCTGCSICSLMCPDYAIEVYRK
jgi:2-oxoglutarate ferredoxin oxidoreductase subunit delta